MVLESVMVCVDTSEWMRNGDLSPNRFCCQQEAVRALIQHKLRNHPENAVGLIAMAENVQTMSSVTRDDRSLIMKINSLNIEGDAKVYMRSLKTAYLALRNRPNPQSRQRIVMFIGSPLNCLEDGYAPGNLMSLAKKYKKEKLSVDFVLFGEAATDELNQKIIDFVDVLNGKDGAAGGSHVVNVPSGENIRLFDVLLRSDICRGTGDDGGGAAPVGLNGDLFGMELEDPELQMALRISLEESRQQYQQQQDREQAVAGQGEGNNNNVLDEGGDEQPIPMDVAVGGSGSAGSGAVGGQFQPLQVDPNAMTEEEQMEYALRMSLIGADGSDSVVDISGSSGGVGDSSSLLKPAPIKPSRSSMGEDGQQQAISSTTATAKTSGTQSPGTPNPTPMEVDTTGGALGGSSDVLGQLIQQPELLKKLVEELPTSRGEGDDKSKGSGKGAKDSSKKDEGQDPDQQKK